MLGENAYLNGRPPSDDELLAALESLERERDELARELAARREAEARLLRLRQDAEAASRAKSDFLARMSHEIRTPMNGVVAMTELLLLTDLDEEQRSCAETIQTSGGLLLEIVDDILDLSRIEAGKVKLEARTFHLRDQLDSILAVVAEQARRKGIALGLTVDEGVPPAFHGPCARLRQVVVNLVANAVKFTHEGEVTVRVRPLGRVGERIKLRFDVRDTGVGIDAARLEKIFLPFEQGGAATAPRGGGAGLGLPICRQLVELMDGELWVKSLPGQGSTFSFTVLLARGEEAARPSEAQPGAARPGAARPAPPKAARDEPEAGGATSSAPPRRERPAVAGSPRILVADDNPINQQVTERWLRKLGYRARVVASGPEVLGALAREPYDLVLMDCEMPGMDGYETTGRIRRGSDQPMIPIVAMTAHAMVGDREKCLEAGMDDYLSKPVKSELLRSVLGHWLGAPAAGAPPARALAPDRAPVTFDALAFHDATADLRDPQRLVGIFLRQAESGVAAIREALAGGDRGELRSLAHNLKGSSSLLGARRFSSLCASLIERRRNGTPTDLVALCGDMEAEIRRVERALAGELAPRS